MALERVRELLQSVTQAARVETVFGDSREVAGKTIIPVARVTYGGGGGGGQGEGGPGGEAPRGSGSGGGGGLGVNVQPIGIFVVTEEAERFVPTLDLSRVIMAGSVVALAAILTVRKIAITRGRWRERARE